MVNRGRISRGKIDASNSATLSQRKVTVLPCDGKVREKMTQMHTSLEEEQGAVPRGSLKEELTLMLSVNKHRN